MRKGTVMSVAVVVLMTTLLTLSSAALRSAWRSQLVIQERRSTLNLVASIDAVKRSIATGGQPSGQVQWPIGKMATDPADNHLTAIRTVRVTWKEENDANGIEIIAEELWGQKPVRSLRSKVENDSRK